jgi:hypothetical protein
MKKKRKVNTRQRRSTSAIILGLGLALLLSARPSFANKEKELQKHYGLIFGTAYGPDDHPLYGVKVRIHPLGTKHPEWVVLSDHRGEFAQRVPSGPGDYVIAGEVELAIVDSAGHRQKRQKLKAETKVHFLAEERQDVSLHLKQ